MYSVYQHWDPLKVCIVGKSYKPEFYSFVKNPKVRSILEKIAEETEEDYQKLIKLLESFNVKVMRPNINDDYNFYMKKGLNDIPFIEPPPMSPRDYTIMLGNKFYIHNVFINTGGKDGYNKKYLTEVQHYTWKDVIQHISEQGNPVINDVNYITEPKDRELLANLNAALITRVGKDLYFGTKEGHFWRTNDTDSKFSAYTPEELTKYHQEKFPKYRCHVINTLGHSDSSFCPVVPGLIVSLHGIDTYKETFPGWEVIYLEHEGWDKVRPFLELKKKNRGKWWIPGQELNDEFTDFIDSWLGHWVGYVEETVFDVNMLVIDEKNVVCNNYNKKVFDAFEQRGITPHIVNFRHRYFWDGGLHCITSDLNREGSMKDYF